MNNRKNGFISFINLKSVKAKIAENIIQHSKDDIYSRFFNDTTSLKEGLITENDLNLLIHLKPLYDSINDALDNNEVNLWFNYGLELALNDLFDNKGKIKAEVMTVIDPDNQLNYYDEDNLKVGLLASYLETFIAAIPCGSIKVNNILIDSEEKITSLQGEEYDEYINKTAKLIEINQKIAALKDITISQDYIAKVHEENLNNPYKFNFIPAAKPSSKLKALSFTSTGVVTGGTIGLGFGLAICVGSAVILGPFAMLPAMIVLPIFTAIGAGIGGVVGIGSSLIKPKPVIYYRDSSYKRLANRGLNIPNTSINKKLKSKNQNYNEDLIDEKNIQTSKEDLELDISENESLIKRPVK